MKKVYSFITMAIIAIVSIGICSNNQELSLLIEANIEALADGETPPKLDCVIGGPVCEVIVMTADDICLTLEIEGMNKPNKK